MNVKRILVFFLLCYLLVTLSTPSYAQRKYKVGLDAFYAGKYEAAISFFKKEVEREKETGDLAAHSSFLLGLSYYKNKQYKEAIQYIKRATEIYKEGMSAYRLGDAWYFWLGRAYYDDGQYKEAASWFLRAAEVADLRPQTKYDGAPNIPEVRSWKEYLIPLCPSKDTCYFWLGNALYFNGQYQEAISALARGIELNPKGSSHYYATMAASYRELKKYEESLAAINKALELGPDDYLYMVLGSIHKARKDNNSAIEAYKKAIGLKPNNIDAYLNVATIYMNDERYAEAEEFLRKAPQSPQTGTNLTFCLMSAGKFDEAIAVSDEEIKRWTRNGLGIDIGIVDKYPVVNSVWPGFPAQGAGIKEGDKILNIDGQPTKGLPAEKIQSVLNPPAGTKVSLSLARKGEKKPLDFSLTSVEMVNTNAALNYALRSLAKGLAGKMEEARSDAREAFRLNPDNIWAKRAVAFSRAMGGELVQAEELSETINLLSSSEENFERMLLALVYSKSGDAERAAKIIAAIPDDYLFSKSSLRKAVLSQVQAALRPYVASKKQNILSYESSGKLKEALGEYSLLMNLLSEEEASEVRKHIGQLIKGSAYLTDVSEEARKHIIRAEMLSGNNDFDRALSEHNEARKIAPFYPGIYKSLATTYEALKEYRQAIRCMTAYLELYPEAPDSREAKDKIIKWEFLLEELNKSK
ncbi:MAG: tetratricopeptide repeat protein [Candidatus Aminicenantes bacterium]|nr:tetratricopeptide repeat protein [Candidatus Aminicenantes bacterium]